MVLWDHVKNFKLPEYIWPPNLVGWWLPWGTPTHRVTRPIWSGGLVRSRDKLKPLYLHYHSAFVHQSWQDGDLPWRNATHKVSWPYNATWSLGPLYHVPWYIIYHYMYHYILYYARSCDKLKLLYLYYHNPHGHQAWYGGDWPWGVPSHNITQLFDHVVLRDRVTN